MEIPLIYTIKFANQLVSLELIDETPQMLTYKTTVYEYDLERNEKAALTFRMVLTQMTEEEKKQKLIRDMFYGKEIPNTGIKITKRDNKEI
jgi:hypothetical protein